MNKILFFSILGISLLLSCEKEDKEDSETGETKIVNYQLYEIHQTSYDSSKKYYTVYPNSYLLNTIYVDTITYYFEYKGKKEIDRIHTYEFTDSKKSMTAYLGDFESFIYERTYELNPSGSTNYGEYISNSYTTKAYYGEDGIHDSTYNYINNGNYINYKLWSIRFKSYLDKTRREYYNAEGELRYTMITDEYPTINRVNADTSYYYDADGVLYEYTIRKQTYFTGGYDYSFKRYDLEWNETYSNEFTREYTTSSSYDDDNNEAQILVKRRYYNGDGELTNVLEYKYKEYEGISTNENTRSSSRRNDPDFLEKIIKEDINYERKNIEGHDDSF